MDKKKLLAVKAQLKRRQPKFLRQQWKKGKLEAVWRKPKGLHSKMKDGLKGYRARLEKGYQTPVAVRGMSKEGLVIARVECLANLKGLDPKTHGIVIAKVSAKSKIAIIKEASAKGFVLLNASVKKADELSARFAARKSGKKAEQKKTESKHAESKAPLDEKLETEASAQPEHAHEHTAAPKHEAKAEPKKAKPKTKKTE